MQENPFSTPQAELLREEPSAPSGFLRGWIITDLVFCAFRILLVPFELIGFYAMKPSNVLYHTVLAEVSTNLGIIAFGLSANILLLRRRRMGLVLGFLALAFVALNITTSLYQVSLQIAASGSGAGGRAMIIGAGSSFVLRMLLNGIYLYVLLGMRRHLPPTSAS